jgi:y4mF family transcriptional regulator
MRVRTPIDIGLTVRRRRRERGLNQRNFAAQLGVTRRWVMDLEKGRPGAALGTVLRALDLLGLRLVLDDDTGAKPASGLPGIDVDALLDRTRGRKP